MSASTRELANAARWNYQAAAYQANPGEKIIADANAGVVVITPPPTPDDGEEFTVAAWRNSTNAVTLHYDGVTTIAGAASDFTPFESSAVYQFVYSATLATWRVIKTGIMA